MKEAPQVEHTPVRMVGLGADLDIGVRVSGKAAVQRVVLHYRPLNQAQDWKQLPMRKGTGDE